MAQSGYTPILLYASGTATNVPLAANMTSSSSGAELALNYADGKLFYKDSGGVVQLLASKATSINVSSITFGSTGLTPNTATTGAVTVAGTLVVANGGTGVTTSTGSGSVVLNTTPTFITNATIPLIYGGTTASSTLTLQSTSGAGTTDSISMKVGNAGAITAISIATTGIASFPTNNAITIPVGTTAQQPGQSGQPTAATGMLRFNSSTTQFEGYNGTTWASVGGAAISNDTSTASFEYPLFASATSGTALTVYTSNAKYLYKPSTGELQASEMNATNGLLLNSATVSTSYSVASGTNALSVGPISVATGQSVTVASGQRWVIL